MADPTTETHPLLANYVERQIEREENTGSERSSEITFLRWTTCDEIRRCSCAILSFILMAALVGWFWISFILVLMGMVCIIFRFTGSINTYCMASWILTASMCI